MSLASVFSLIRASSRFQVPFRLVRAASIVAAGLAAGNARAQSSGSVDSSFLSATSGTTIFGIALEYNGKDATETVAVGGDLDTFFVLDGTGIYYGDFVNPLFGSEGRTVYTITPEVLPDTAPEQLLIGGIFGQTLNDDKVVAPSRNILRISLDGVFDPAFDPGKGADDLVTSILPQSDGSIFVGGQFLTFDQKPYVRLVRLDYNGSISAGFPPLPVSDTVFALAAQIDPSTGAPNGQVLVGGDFQTVGNSTYPKLVRIDQAGNIDSSFKPVIDQRVLAIAVQPDGKIVIGGQFISVDGQAVDHIARLNQDGSLDGTFVASVTGTPALTTAPVAVYTLKLLADGRLYVGGNFGAVDGVGRQFVARIQGDGTLDAGFDPGTAIANSAQTIGVQLDNRVLVGQTLAKKVNNVEAPSLVRLFGDPVNTLASVSVTAITPNAHERTGGRRKKGVFGFKRVGGDTTVPLTVYFYVSGTAQSGLAYEPFQGEYDGAIHSATFAANETELKLKVKPLEATLPDAPETVTLALLPSQDGAVLYGPVSPTIATVEISNER